MQLDRNMNIGRGKYALIKLRERMYRGRNQPIIAGVTSDVAGGLGARYAMVLAEAIDYGDTMDNDFFVIRLKDKYAADALSAYAKAAMADGEIEYGKEINELAIKAIHHPNSRKPD